MNSRIAVPDLCYVKPLISGVDTPQSGIELVYEIPSKISLMMSERSDNIQGAFLSPIDYARHGAEYCIVPGIAVSSSVPSKTILLFIRENVSNIHRIAVDIRYTSEIILAKIILLEKYRNLTSSGNMFQFLPMAPNVDEMLKKADAALIVQSPPLYTNPQNVFALDLVEEWYDLTELPYVHGFWVGREEELTENEAKQLLEAHHRGKTSISAIVNALAPHYNLSAETLHEYLNRFTFEFEDIHEASLEEFFHYAFFYGSLPDVPDVRFFDLPPELLTKQQIH